MTSSKFLTPAYTSSHFFITKDIHWGPVIGPSPRPDKKYLNDTKIEIYVPFRPDNEYDPITSTAR